MRTSFILRGACLIVGLLPRTGLAAEVVLTPLLGDSTVTAKQKVAVHQLMASELDFAPEVDALRDLAVAPPGLNESCLSSVACLQAIALANEASAVVTGKMTAGAGKYTLDLVYYEGGAIVRRKKFSAPQDATQLANAMTPIIRELLTGDTPLDDADQTPSLDDFADDEEIAIAAGSKKPSGSKPGATAAPAKPAPSTGPQYTAEELNAMIKFGSPGGGTSPAPAPPAPPAEGDGVAVGEVSHTRVRSSERPQGVPDVQKDHPVGITVRGGYSVYGVFDFLTAGGEASIGLAKNVRAVGGVEVFAVRRTPPDALALAEGVVAKWDFIYPMNLGLVYVIPIQRVQPYVGADFVFARYYHDEIGSDWAGGGRLRGGVNWMASSTFGFNVNAAAGAWTGGNWDLIESGLKETGFFPQISAGTVFSF